MARLAPLIAMFVLLLGCSQRTAALSPDGSLTLVTTIEHSRQDPTAYSCVVFEIRDRAGRILHRENTHASDTMRWTMAWESNTRVRLDSSDIGTYRWSRQQDEGWRKE
jgi:hypothetical protein